MEEMKFVGWAIVNKCGDSQSSLLYKDKKEADKHCEGWNRSEGLSDYRPYRPVELFQRVEPQRDSV